MVLSEIIVISLKETDRYLTSSLTNSTVGIKMGKIKQAASWALTLWPIKQSEGLEVNLAPWTLLSGGFPTDLGPGVNSLPLWFCCDWWLKNPWLVILSVQECVCFVVTQNCLSDKLNILSFMQSLAEEFSERGEVLTKYKIQGLKKIKLALLFYISVLLAIRVVANFLER